MDLTGIKRVAVVCPVWASGGPEALHQLSQVAGEIGLESWMIYTDAEHRNRVAHDHIQNIAPRAPEIMQF